MKRESIRLIIDLVLAVALGAAVFSLVVFLLFRRALIQPIRELTGCVERIADGQEVTLPRFDTHELRELRRAIEKACEARAHP